MKAKLIKLEYGYALVVDNTKLHYIDSVYGKVIADTLGDNVLQLSLKNCQAIESGYDLDELAIDYIGEPDKKHWHPVDHSDFVAFKDGFEKALELMGDKKFSEEDVRNAMNWIMAQYFEFNEQPTTGRREHYIQSLQQTEWDVEVEMVKEEYIWSPPGEGFEDQTYRDWREVPKLDADGCLILKRI